MWKNFFRHGYRKMRIFTQPGKKPTPYVTKPCKSKKKINAIVLISFLAYLIVGVFIYRDYGISEDEATQRGIDAVSAAYINNIFHVVSLKNIANYAGNTTEIPNLKDWRDRDYGVLFELVLLVPEIVLKLKDSKVIFETRHLLTFVTFWVSVIFFYFLIQESFNDWKFGLTGCLFLVLSPRIFADSFYNNKDIILLSFTIVATYTLTRFLRQPNLLNALFHAITSAAVTDIRIVGVYLPVVSIFFIGLEVIKSESPIKEIKVWLKPVGVYIVGVFGFIYLFWPFLWENPIHNFLFALNNMSKFRYGGSVLYWGKFIKTTELPWHYIPSWILITTPIIYSLFFTVGTGAVFLEILKHPIYKSEEQRNQLLFFSLFIIPLVAVIMLHSVLYSGWRHMFFVYPFYILIALFVIQFCFRVIRHTLPHKYSRPLLILLLIATLFNLSFTGFFMIKNHPHQNVYFNILAGSEISKNFDLDYWAVSYRQLLEFITGHDPSDAIYICALVSYPGELNQRILNERDRLRINFVSVDEAKYFITNYHGRNKLHFYSIRELYSIKVDNFKISGVYQLR